MSKAIKWLVGADIVLAAVALVWGGSGWLLNTQVAFLSSALVLGASMFSYRQMVYSRLSDDLAIAGNERDALDKMEDPYDLYGEDVPKDASTIKDVIKEV